MVQMTSEQSNHTVSQKELLEHLKWCMGCFESVKSHITERRNSNAD